MPDQPPLAKPAQAKFNAFLLRVRRYLIIGVLTAIPIWVTWLVVDLLFKLLADTGKPFVLIIAGIFRPFLPAVSDWLSQTWFQSLLAIILVFLVLYFLGWMTTQVLGKKMLNTFEEMISRIPVAKVIYSSAKKMLVSFQKKPDEVQRVVLINFPSNEMKTVGFVTRTMTDADTGRQLAAVYVPTTPNPTSGYLEIMPVENIVSTDWTVDEAMAFIISAGAVTPDKINYEKSVGSVKEPIPEA